MQSWDRSKEVNATMKCWLSTETKCNVKYCIEMQYWDRPKYDNAVVQEGKNQCNILVQSFRSAVYNS